LAVKKPLSIFRGRDGENNRAIIWALSLHQMTTWEVARAILRLRSGEPKAVEVQGFYPTVFKCIKGSAKRGGGRTEGLESLGYVREVGTKTSKGHEVPLYSLTLKGSLAALFLHLEKPTYLKRFLQNMTSVNPLFELAWQMLRRGVDEALVREILQEWKDALDRGLLNLDIADDGTIVYTLFLTLQGKLIKMFDEGMWTKESLEKVSEAFRSSVAFSQIGVQTKLDYAYPSLYLESLEAEEEDDGEREKIRLLKRIFEDIQEAVTG